MASYEKGQVSTVVNRSLKENAPIKPYPYLLTTGVTILKCNKDRLPVKKVFDTLYKISDTIKALLDAKFINKYAGTFSY